MSPGIVQGSKSQQIVIAGIHGGNSRLSALKLSLTELNNGAEAKFVTCLCESERLSGLFPKLIGNRNAPKRGLRVQDCNAHVPGDGVGEFLGLLFGSFLTKANLLSLGIYSESSKEWEGKVHSSGGVPVGDEDSVWSDGCDASDRQCRDGR